MVLTLQKGEIVHQVCHAIGLWHEHQRPDRDQYIELLKVNIPAEELADFKAIPSALVDSGNLPYDYTSVMHFHGKVTAQTFAVYPGKVCKLTL